MQIRIIIANRTRCLLVELEREEYLDEIKHLVQSRKRKKAMERALSNGRFIKELDGFEIPFVDADLTLTDVGAYWNSL